jgi:hypothetical protein
MTQVRDGWGDPPREVALWRYVTVADGCSWSGCVRTMIEKMYGYDTWRCRQ